MTNIDQENPKTTAEISFGSFRLMPAERRLEKEGVTVQLGGRALDILMVLVEHAGEVVSKRDLIERVWRDVTVDEGSLRFQIGALRKALGDGHAGARYVKNVPGRGYCFVERISVPPKQASFSKAPSGQSHRLPNRLVRMVGRDDFVEALCSRVLDRRFVTLVGPGGIGKTTVAISVAHALFDKFAGAVRFIDLGTVSDPRLVASNLASALGLPVGSDDAVPALIQHLRGKLMLLIFDSCEHVIEAVAALSEAIFADGPLIHILATSREPLRVEGEHIDRLFPLDYPPDDPGLTAAEAMDFPAVQLFMERVIASTPGVVLSDQDARTVAKICRKLDGLALAIELAAGRVALYGIQATATLLDDRLGLLWQGRRTAPPRQQTLTATLDWSYQLLPEIERVVLRRLAIFVGSFSLEAALEVVADDGLRTGVIAEAVAHLVEKSLLSIVLDRGQVRYRLLDTTCAYAKRQLSDSGETNTTARRHAVYSQKALETDSSGLSEMIRPEQMAKYVEQVGNIRSALEWCFSVGGDCEVGVALTAAATPVLLSMSLWQECQRWTEQAIEALGAADRGTRRELTLLTALGKSLLARHDPRGAAYGVLTRALSIAEALDDAAQQIRLLSELRVLSVFSGDARGALELALRSKTIADTVDDPRTAALSEAELGISYYIAGKQADAQRHCEAALMRARTIATAGAGHFEKDIFVQTRCALASALWLRGFPDQAAVLGKQIIDEIETTDDFLLLSNALLWIIPVFLWRGDWSRAEHLIDRLTRNAREHSLGVVEHIGLGLRGQLLIGRGEIAAGIPLIQKCQEALPVKAFQVSNITCLASGLAAGADIEAALRTIDEVTPERYNVGRSQLTAEIFRVKGDILASAPEPNSESAEQWLLEAANIAREQSALSWELRITANLSALLKKLGRRDQARRMLTSVYSRFTEGFDTLDLKMARSLLDEFA